VEALQQVSPVETNGLGRPPGIKGFLKLCRIAPEVFPLQVQAIPIADEGIGA
jgi:hypothetical protein